MLAYAENLKYLWCRNVKDSVYVHFHQIVINFTEVIKSVLGVVWGTSLASSAFWRMGRRKYFSFDLTFKVEQS